MPNERASGWNKMIAIGMLPGVSDLIVVRKERILFVEVKDHKGVQRPNQVYFENKVKALGFEYYLVRSLDEFKEIF